MLAQTSFLRYHQGHLSQAHTIKIQVRALVLAQARLRAARAKARKTEAARRAPTQALRLKNPIRQEVLALQRMVQTNGDT